MRKLTFFPLIVAVAFLCGFGTKAHALDLNLGEPLGPGEPRWGVGLQFGFSSGGLSAKYRFSNTVTAQGTLGFFGSLQNYGVRGLYAFKKEPQYDIYGFAGLGVWRWDGSIFFRSESAVGVSGGGGIEYMLENVPVALSAELGFALLSFDNYDGFSGFGIGLGAHYYFQ